MGVTGLWKLIEPCGKPVPVETLEGKVLAVDISIWLHQAVKGFQDNKGSALPNAHLLGLFHRLCKLLYYRVKPVFVFDGCVPQLKRETIARRQQQRSKLNTEAERIQALLLQSLAKEKVVQQALGVNAELLLKSPTKRVNAKSDNVDEIFKLPELPTSLNKQGEEDSSNLNDASLTSFTSNDDYASTSADDSSSFDESNARTSYNANLQAIDVKSQHFRNLPADVRHEILVDIKETRKQSSWGRLHELPSKGDDFSVFQMKRLLKRRAVQESLEEAEQEMGGRTLTYAELSNLFTEEGILEPKALEEGSKQICSDEHTRFLLVRDLKKKLSKSEAKALEVKKEDDSKVEDSFIVAKTDTEESKEKHNEELGKEYDTELELALAMSLEDTQVYSQSDYKFESNEELKLNRSQRKCLQNAAIGPARAYMIEYGGMNEEEVENIMEKTQTDNKIENTLEGILDFQLEKQNKKDSSKEVQSDQIEIPNESESQEICLRVSDSETESDSDLEEVVSGNENNGSEKEKENKLLEIVVDIDYKISDDEDDMFADVFVAETETGSLIESKKTERDLGEKVKYCVNTNMCSQESIITIPDSQDSIKVLTETESSLKLTIVENKSILELDKNESKLPNAKTQSILSDLKNQLDEVSNINLDDIKVDANVKISDDDNKTLEFAPTTPVETEVVEICDSDDGLPLTLLSTKSPNLKTPTKSHSILEYFPTDYVIKRTPDKAQHAEHENVPKVTSPFFVKKTPKSNRKISATKNNSASSSPSQKSTSSKASKSLFEEIEKSTRIDSDNSLGVEPIKLTPVNTEELINEAAEKLKEQKTEDELKAIASNLAKERRDLESERNRQDRMSMPISQRMSSECQELLKLFGIPYIVAPMEAEAQCAFLDSIELTNGTITDDSDIWLFGGRTVYKNFFAQNKHVLEFRAEKIETSFNCDRKKLIQLACLVGSDYTTGINGIGAVTALEILASFTPVTYPITDLQKHEKNHENIREIINTVLNTLNKFREWWLLHKTSNAPIGTSARLALRKKLKNIELHDGFPSLAVVEAYLTPKVDENRDAFSWGYPDVESIREYAKKTFGWTTTKTNDILMPVIKRLNEKKSQATIRNYFTVKSAISMPQLKVSKRVQKAIDRMSGLVEIDTPEKSIIKKPTKKRVARAKKQASIMPESTTDAELKVKNDMEIDVAESIAVSEEQPTTSKQSVKTTTRKRAASNLHSKKSDIIPQREKDKAIMLENKIKAAEILKQQISKENNKKKRKS